MADVIDPDDEATWPEQVTSLINANMGLIKDYEHHQARLNKPSQSEYIAQGQPTNPLRDERDRIVAQIDDVLSEFHLVGYHATRLTESETSDLAGGLLDVLSIDLVKRRIDRACADGFLTPEDADKLAKSSLAADLTESHGKRIGMVWLIFFKSLARTDGLYRLFRYWGGEATYWAHEETKIGEALKHIGKPALLECDVSVSDLSVFYPIGERFVAAFMERRGLRCVNGYEFQAYSRTPVRVSRVIPWGTKEFDDLTCHHDWYAKLV